MRHYLHVSTCLYRKPFFMKFMQRINFLNCMHINYFTCNEVLLAHFFRLSSLSRQVFTFFLFHNFTHQCPLNSHLISTFIKKERLTSHQNDLFGILHTNHSITNHWCRKETVLIIFCKLEYSNNINLFENISVSC